MTNNLKIVNYKKVSSVLPIEQRKKYRKYCTKIIYKILTRSTNIILVGYQYNYHNQTNVYIKLL